MVLKLDLRDILLNGFNEKDKMAYKSSHLKLYELVRLFFNDFVESYEYPYYESMNIENSPYNLQMQSSIRIMNNLTKEDKKLLQAKRKELFKQSNIDYQ